LPFPFFFFFGLGNGFSIKQSFGLGYCFSAGIYSISSGIITALSITDIGRVQPTRANFSFMLWHSTNALSLYCSSSVLASIYKSLGICISAILGSGMG